MSIVGTHPAVSPDADVWRVLAPAIAQRPVMRVSRDGGKNYPHRGQRRLALEAPPNQPAAVPTWGADGTTRMIAFDLDTKRGDVEAECAQLLAVIEQAGGTPIVDASPSGGRHVYLLLADPITLEDATPLLRGLADRFRTLDILPMLNVTDGLIRPPGARHKTGGWQTLITPLAEATRLLSSRNPRSVVERLTRLCPAPRTERVRWDHIAADLPALDRVHREITGRWAVIARTGDVTGYASPSEARQAVVWAAAASGWSFAELVARLEAGQLPGLAALYRRYHTRHYRAALTRDWKAALTFERTRARKGGQSSAHVRNTRGPQTHGGPSPTAHTQIRQWVTSLRFCEKHRWTDPSKILVMRALGQMAQRRGELTIAVGVRSLALATHLDPATVSRHLSALRAEADPLIVRVEEGRRREADEYALVVPHCLQDMVERTRYERGQIRALLPVFRTLGPAAGFVYEALQTARDPLQVLDLIGRLPWAESTIRDALDLLAAWDLASKTPRGWVIGAANPQTVAAITGATELHQHHIDRYQAQRERWWTFLGHHYRTPGQRPPHQVEPDPIEPDPIEPDPPPPQEAVLDDLELAAFLIMSELGGREILA